MSGVVSKRRLIKKRGGGLSVRTVFCNVDTVRQDTRRKSPTSFVRRLSYEFLTAALLAMLPFHAPPCVITDNLAGLLLALSLHSFPVVDIADIYLIVIKQTKSPILSELMVNIT